MAQLKFTLPALKLTKHHRSGSQSVSYLPRILPGHRQELPLVQTQEDNLQERNAIVDDLLPENGIPEVPTSYELERKSSIAGWNEVRKGILSAVTELSGD